MDLPLGLLGSYFQVKLTPFNLGSTAPVQILAADPTRWAFDICFANGTNVFVSSDPDPTFNPQWVSNTIGERFGRIFRDYGGLTQLPHFAATTAAPSGFVVTEIMYRPPQQAIIETQ